MKVHNAVIGMEVQVKRDCRGHSDEFIKKGLVCTVSRIDDGYMADYELRLKHPDIDDGFAWVNASDVRRYKEEVKEEVPEEPQDDIQVGDSVLVGAEGAGYGFVDKAYAGLTCTIHPMKHRQTNIVYIQHPDVRDSRPYAAHKRNLTKVDPKPVRPDLSSLRVGDYIVANGTDPHLQEGVAYRVVQEGATFPLIALHHSENANWREGYCVISRNVAKILREVNDATPRS